MTAAKAIIPPLTFTLPAGFRQLPLDGEAGEREAAVYTVMADLLAASGVEFAAFALLDDGDGGVGHCSLTVAAMSSDHPSAEVAANGIREIFAREPLRDTRWLDLPCGPAVGVVSVRAVPVGTDGDGGVRELPVGQIQVHVPFPNDPWIALFTVETTAMEQWDRACSAVAGMMKSIRFTRVGSP